MRDPKSTEKYSNLWESTQGAAKGFYLAIKEEDKIRQVFLCMCAVVVVCMIGDVGYFQILMVIFSWVLALICEIFNTALEKALDFSCNKEFHPLVRQGKDYAAACTFVALVFAGSLTFFVLWGRHSGKDYPREKTFEAIPRHYQNN
jgi:diacylglycerol kinase (ATP)